MARAGEELRALVEGEIVRVADDGGGSSNDRGGSGDSGEAGIGKAGSGGDGSAGGNPAGQPRAPGISVSGPEFASSPLFRWCSAPSLTFTKGLAHGFSPAKWVCVLRFRVRAVSSISQNYLLLRRSCARVRAPRGRRCLKTFGAAAAPRATTTTTTLTWRK